MTRPSIHNLSAVAAIAIAVSVAVVPLAKSESLFRAQASYEANTAYTPPSIFSQPIPHQVGDLVTILVNETPVMDDTVELSTNRQLQVNEGATPLNNLVRFFLSKLPFNTTGLTNALSLPSYTQSTSSGGQTSQITSNQVTSTGDTKRTSTITDKITCQVMQVLPNGFLVVQGHKIL